MANSVRRKYEALFLVDAATATADWKEVLEATQTVMSRAGATIISLNKWDERRLCYEIKGRIRGTYILCYFDAPAESISGIERDVQISEVFLRVMILRTDNIPADIIDKPTPDMVMQQEEKEAAERKEAKAAEDAKAQEEAASRQKEEAVNADAVVSSSEESDSVVAQESVVDENVAVPAEEAVIEDETEKAND